MHPKRTHKGKINLDDLNGSQENRRKTGNLIHGNSDVVANSEKGLG